MTPQLVLFDIDGTLIHSGGAGLRSLTRALRGCDLDPSVLDRIALSGRTDHAIMVEVLDECRVREDRRAELLARLEGLYLDGLSDCVAESSGKAVLPGVVRLLDALSEVGAQLGLATGNLARGARAKLAWCDLWRRFPVGGFGDGQVCRAKLVEQAIERAAAHWAYPYRPAAVLLIGDTPLDVAAGKAVGVTTLAVATGSYSRRELAACEPTHLLASLSDSAAVLRALPTRCGVEAGRPS